MAHITDDQLKDGSTLKLIKIPQYSDQDIDVEYRELKARRRKRVMRWFLMRYPFILLASIIGSVIIYHFPSFLLVHADAHLTLILTDLQENIFWISFSAFLVGAIFGSALCPIHRWFSAPKRNEAEFALRVRLTNDQKVNASDDKKRQIFAYCILALD